MWTADANDIVPLRDGTGKPFTGFVDSLIRTHGFVYGVGEADIRTNLRTNYPDGGVDTQVCLAMHGDPTGYLTLPTCWQFKAWSYREIDDAYLSKEVHKAFAAKLIAEGYAYRFAICAEMPPEKQAEWETLLTAAARSINPQAPEARVASASQLAYWANRYPPLLFAQCGIDPGPVFYFEAWKKNATKTTPIFVAVDEWRQKDKRIRSHIDFSQPVKSPVITLQGMAGVGKTRLAYEILASLAGAHNLVFYTTDGSDAEVVARFLANNSRTRGVLVADECPLLSRARIEEGLKGHTDRIRVVCIDNSGERMGGNEELWLEELSPPAVEKVLAENFSRVPADRRRVYAAQSGGYVRLAAVLCEHDVEIQSTGHFDPALVVIHEQYRKWLPEERQQKAVAAISLVQRVGFGEGVQEELEALCVFTGQERNGVLEVVAALKDAPGFVAQTTRYLYVTPEIIARAAFARAWKRWFQSDPADALRRLPPVLLSSFLARVALSASPEVRALTGQFFWDSVASMQPSDLADEDLTDRLTALVETQPDRYFPRLALLVRQSTPGQLRESKGGLRGGRRTLVWAAERLAAFPTHFCEAEEILRRLALAETEDGIGNNATGIWKQMFRIVLSGAATPFRERIGLLGRLIFSTDPEESALALGALEATLDLTGTRFAGPSVIAGRLVPPDWRPSSTAQFRECLELILALFDRIFDQGPPPMREAAWSTLSKHIRPLLGHRMLPTLRAIVERHSIPPARLPDVLESIEDSLQYECRGESGGVANDPYCHEVAEWLRALTPSDFMGRLKAVIGKDPWHHSVREEVSGIPSEILPLAEDLGSDPARFEAVLPYLNSPDARSAGLLGQAIARQDAEGRHLDRILAAAAENGSSALACGYVAGLLATYPNHAERLNVWLDGLEERSPELAYFVSLSAPDFARPLERTLRLIGKGKLPVQFLQNFIASVLLDRMSSDELKTVLDLLVRAADPESLHIAVDFVGHCVQKGRVDDPAEREAMWRALEASAPVEDRAHHWWIQAVQRFTADEPLRACEVAIRALTGDDLEKRNLAWSVLSSIAATKPDLVMEKVGQVLLIPEHGWRLQMPARPGLFQSLPLETLRRWMSEDGVERARVIANQLRPPSVDADGKPQVPPLTEFVLTNWGDDDIVFRRFAASTRNGQWYTGDIASAHRREADRARAFLSHPIAAIRKWAEYEVARGEQQAKDWTIEMEESVLH